MTRTMTITTVAMVGIDVLSKKSAFYQYFVDGHIAKKYENLHKLDVEINHIFFFSVLKM